MNWLAVALGGAVGSCLRYGLMRAVEAMASPGWFPWATFAANVLGSFALVLVLAFGAGKSVWGLDVLLLLGVGVMGGFTTYSSFNEQSLSLLEQGLWGRAAAYMGTTALTCLAAGALGLLFARFLR